MPVDNSVYICYIHDYETNNINDWLDHKTSVIHHDSGISLCILCGKQVRFENVVPTNKKKAIEVVCKPCGEKKQIKGVGVLTGKIVHG